MKMHQKAKWEWCLPCIACMALMASAQAQHADIEISVADGRLVADPRVAEGAFGEAPNPPHVADEPGFDVDDGNLNPGDILGFNVMGFDLGGGAQHIWHWDGTGDVRFGPSPADLTIENPVSTLSLSIPAAGSGTLTGFPIAAADDRGGLHQDLEFILSEASSANGVYAWALEMTSPGYASSEPVFFVMAANVEESVHELAVDFVTRTMGVPEPTSAVLILCWFCSAASGVRRSVRMRAKG